MRKTLAFLILATLPLHADEDTFREQFANPVTRMAALARLTPGSEEAYFRTALAYQLAGREMEFRQVMAEWKAAGERQEEPVSLDGYDVLENRDLLLSYRSNADASLEGLIRKLKLKFDDARPDAQTTAESTPSSLDPSVYSTKAIEDIILRNAPDAPYRLYRGKRLADELAGVADFDEAKVRWFLEHTEQAEHPAVTLLVDRSLGFAVPIKFGSLEVHRKMVFQQLDALLKLRPELLSDLAFNIAYLTKMRPGTEVDFGRDKEAHAAHLQRCRDHVMKLPAALNSLKAHVLFHHLRLQSELGKLPKEDFLSFLSLPRSESNLFPGVKGDALPYEMEADYDSATGCPAIGDEMPLLQLYLDHYLGVDDDAAAEFAPYIKTETLRLLQARARLLAGAPANVWASVLPAEEFKALNDEAFIRFAADAPEIVPGDAQLSLNLDLKNTPELRIRIYGLDLAGWMARNDEDLDVSMDLEGLIPHHERRLKFGYGSLQRHREAIALPELTGSGAWIVEFVSGQVSARSLIRKGQLIPFVQRTGKGQFINVMDEKGVAVPRATLKLGDETFTADASGQIFVPNGANHSATEGVIQSGNLAAKVSLDARTEDLVLKAGFHLEREQLLADRQAKLLMQVNLTNHGHSIPLDRIQEPALVMKAELQGGITIERVVAQDLKLAPFMEIPFQVPAELLHLTFTLKGAIEAIPGEEKQKLSDTYSYSLNGALEGTAVQSATFHPTPGGHRLELRGRNGEPLPSRILQVELGWEDYTQGLSSKVRTDEQGRVELGNLDGIRQLTVSGPGMENATYYPQKRRLLSARNLQVAEGKEVIFPLGIPVAAPERSRLSLIEHLANGTPARDHFDKLRVEDGRIVIRGLAAGEYVFVQDGMESNITVSSGTERDGLVVSPSWILPVEDQPQAFIASATSQAGQVAVQIKDHRAETKIIISGGVFAHSGWNSGTGALPFVDPSPAGLIPGASTCGYLTDRRLDDEIRYIFDRRSQRIFPGSMLPRPGLLLNRWTEREIEQDTKLGEAGSEGKKSGSPRKSRDIKISPKSGAIDSTEDYEAAFDFIATPSTIRLDLKPDAEGWIRIPVAEFGSARYLRIQVMDHADARDSVILPLENESVPLRDRRLASPLNPEGHHLATRSAAVLAKGAEAAIENLLDAEWRAFTTLEEAHQYLYGASGDDRLREFAFLLDWPGFDEKKKLELLSTHACHELHLFLKRKDRAFFDKHVKPFLIRKPEKVFMDDLLLERDLKDYLRPYAWQRMNAAEKALLAQALPEAKERVARELSLRWQLEAPTPDVESQLFTQTLRGTDLATVDSLGLARVDTDSSGVAYVTQKLRTIIIPEINFENVTLAEAVQSLRVMSAQYDTLELDPAKKGVNIIVRTSHGQEQTLIRELQIRNVPLQVAIQYVCDAVKLRPKMDDFSVMLVPLSESWEDLFTRSFGVSGDFVSKLGGVGDQSIVDILKSVGIQFRDGSSATLRNGRLTIRNTPSELEKVEALTQSVQLDGLSMRESPADPFAGGTLPSLPTADAALEERAPMDPFASADAGGASALRARISRPRFNGLTRLWRESNYFRCTSATDESLISLKRFWIDLAEWNGEGGFLSAHFNACTENANEALMCLALLDLPFKADRPEVTVDGGTMRVKAREPMLLFYKDTKSTDKVAQESPLLVRQTYTSLAEPFRTVDGKQIENPVTGDFRPGVAYRASLVVTNPTGTGRRVDLLAQIPAGSIPLGGYPATLSMTSDLAPYGVVMKELQFYFPVTGSFAAYPLHVSEEGTVLAHSEGRNLRVSDDASPPVGTSWLATAANGTNEAVLEMLSKENLQTLNLDAILWRLKDKDFFTQVTRILRERLHHSQTVSAYGFLHNDVAAMRDYLENGTMLGQTGQWLDSPLLEVRPRIHKGWETLEFDPLVNARAHRFGEESRITHEEAKRHYHAFLDQLAWKSSLDAPDLLSLSAFFFLQDRIEEGLEYFDRIDPAALPDRMQYDYLKSVALFYRVQPQEAKEIATSVLPSLPPGIWRDRFQAVISQADEISGLAKKPMTKEQQEETTAPRLDLEPSGTGKLVLNHRGMSKAELRFFRVDLEILFSKDPFLQGGIGGEAEPRILPNATLEMPLSDGTTETTIELPEAMKGGNVLVSAASGSTRMLKVIDSGNLDVRRQPLDHTVQVLDIAGHPLPKTYVKVYAENRAGEITFHKDGYTDLRGKFDYLSHTGIDTSTIRRLAVLTSHPEKGAKMMIYER